MAACSVRSIRSIPVGRTRPQGAVLVRGSNGFLGGLFGGRSDKEKQEAKQAPSEVFMMASTSAQPEFPPYTVVSKAGVYTVRLYQVYPVVEMEYSRREQAYAALGGYIDGENSENTRFAYTQPVVMRYPPSGAKTMQMFLGSRRLKGSKEQMPPVAASDVMTLPTPKDAAVQVSVAGGELVAVLQFDGYITPENAGAARKRLAAALKNDGVALADEEENGMFRVAQYGAVYQLGGRLNEVMLRIKI